MRHTFVSLLSSNGTALEDIADLVGHKGTATTETVYRKVIVPELRRGAEVMDRLFTDMQPVSSRRGFSGAASICRPSA
jgi:integrase